MHDRLEQVGPLGVVRLAVPGVDLPAQPRPVRGEALGPVRVAGVLLEGDSILVLGAMAVQQQGALLPAATLLPGQLDKKGLSRADEVPAAAAGDECFSSLPAPVPFVSFSSTTGCARE